MRRARLTFDGAFHHAMNRGHGGETIFRSPAMKRSFLVILAETAKKLRMRIMAYCIMDNHYHLLLENSSGRMSDFFKSLNGQYGYYYRSKVGGSGYVFQGRYHSTLIQDESYLLMAIAYVLGNPVRSGQVKDFLDYPWSSAGEYFTTKDGRRFVDRDFVESLFGSSGNLIVHVREWQRRELPIIYSDMGPIIGGDEFLPEAKDRHERRRGGESVERKRKEDFGFEPFEKVYREFWQMNRLAMDDLIDTGSRAGQRLRGELLMHLKERAGLKYSEIIKLPEFVDVRFGSLGKIYLDAKRRVTKVKK